MHPFFFRFPFHLGHHRALGSLCYPVGLISYRFYIQCQCIYANPNLPIHPTSPLPLSVYTVVLYWGSCVLGETQIIHTHGHILSTKMHNCSKQKCQHLKKGSEQWSTFWKRLVRSGEEYHTDLAASWSSVFSAVRIISFCPREWDLLLQMLICLCLRLCTPWWQVL